MTARTDTYRPRRINRYVPAMGYAAGVIHAAPYEINFGAPALADADGILDGHSIATAGVAYVEDMITDTVDAPFGRCLQIVLSGAGTPVVTIRGRDYLGQPVAEQFTGNGAAAVVGTKAFKYIDSITYGAVAATTIDVGTTDKLGLPFKTTKVLAERSNGVDGTVGALVTPSLVDPATAVTTDPRGTYDPNVALDGTKVIAITALLDNSLNTSGNGGLHGLAHYYA